MATTSRCLSNESKSNPTSIRDVNDSQKPSTKSEVFTTSSGVEITVTKLRGRQIFVVSLVALTMLVGVGWTYLTFRDGEHDIKVKIARYDEKQSRMKEEALAMETATDEAVLEQILQQQAALASSAKSQD